VRAPFTDGKNMYPQTDSGISKDDLRQISDVHFVQREVPMRRSELIRAAFDGGSEGGSLFEYLCYQAESPA